MHLFELASQLLETRAAGGEPPDLELPELASESPTAHGHPVVEETEAARQTPGAGADPDHSFDLQVQPGLESRVIHQFTKTPGRLGVAGQYGRDVRAAGLRHT